MEVDWKLLLALFLLALAWFGHRTEKPNKTVDVDAFWRSVYRSGRRNRR